MRIRLNRSERQTMSPAVGVLLLVTVVAGFLKLFLPRWGMPWQYLYLMIGVAAVLVLDTIRGAIAAAAGSPRPWGGSNVPVNPPAGLQVRPDLVVGTGEFSEKQRRIVDLYQELERHGGAVLRLWPSPEKSAGASSIGP